jgi:uroporphyrinogen-III synthase
MHVLVTRPEPDASATRAQLEALGHEVTVEPLLQIEPLPIDAEAFAGAQGLIATSRNGLRALAAGSALTAARTLPIFTVGPGTAELARTQGFHRIIESGGAARDLVPLIASRADPAGGPLVHAAGEVPALDLAAALTEHGIAVRTLTAYRAVAAERLTPSTAQRICDGAIDAALLMSPRTAAILARLVASAGLTEQARRLTFLCLSQGVAEELRGLAPPHVEIAAEPNSAALLAVLARVATQSPGV